MRASDVEVWDRAARGYARQEHLEHRALACALDLAAPEPHESLLDAATGTGLVLRTLARRPAPPARATGVDVSAQMLARVGPLRDGWSTLHADATALPLADGTYDVAVAAYLLQVLGAVDREATLVELHRVVRPGGRLVLVTPWAAQPGRALLAALARAAPATLRGLNPHDPRPGLAAAGWTIRRAVDLRGGYPSLVVLANRS